MAKMVLGLVVCFHGTLRLITKCISKTSSKSESSASQNESQIETDQNNNFPSRSVQFSASAGRNSSSLNRSTNLELNPLYIGHAILAEFETSLSTVEIDQFVSILEQEESSADATRQDNLREILRIKYGIWKGLIRRYFGHISISHGESSLAPVTIQKLDLGPVPSVPEKSFRKRELSSPILTGERAKKQLADQEKRKQERGKRRNDEFDEDFDEDFDEGYHQYMAISKAKGKKIVKAGKGGLLLEGTRRSSRLIAKSKIEEKEVEVRKIVVEKTAKDSTSKFYGILREDSTEVLCFYCKELGCLELSWREKMNNEFFPQLLGILVTCPKIDNEPKAIPDITFFPPFALFLSP
ncbi:hypothetical protein DAPPUDRAFT_115814 [Daphnia pulex]|uniref:Uncharacterized protein n=1 Tax=Daphnia pulex TaxID=6669 RepID=E9HMM1_DAPPU|nr:hypothetical protein DAPPUDRAFT_115814 [Daphnia pulex]|eukprot:EFX67016.1 hypothetical protein DAPPUDRAFT_115814 [Daphnia pulex]